MKLKLEQWLEDQALSGESLSCFEESFICYKVGAYKAALLFGYLGFQTIVRDRIMQSQPPQGIPSTLWMKIQKSVSNHSSWDGATFCYTQQQKPAPIFAIDQELRDQVKYWKDRRNDCAHSKDNQIVAAHCESFYAFVRSTLNRFFVGSSLESLKQEFRDFFDPTLTPAGAPAQGLVQDVGTFLGGHDLSRFVSESFEAVKKEQQSREPSSTDAIPSTARLFLADLLKYGSQDVKDEATKFITQDRERCYHFLRENTKFVYIAEGNSTLIRWLWNRAGNDAASDYPLVSGLLRNRLIPTDEIQEALRTFISKAPSGRPSQDEREELKNHGYYDELKNAAINSDMMGNFKKAKASRALLVDLLDCVTIDLSLAKGIFVNFNFENHAFSLRDALDEFFQTRADKREEYRQAIADDSELGIPKHLTVLDK